MLQAPVGPLGEGVNIAGTVILLVMLLALAGFVYRSLQDDGIRWPGETDTESEDVRRRPSAEDDDDEWKYY
ncbi:hypothetical protein DVK02_10510 [Halobellus sp. Atlit-31R]|nr:hypothetical protein DVK02_10510 [Halobellus sp. Atlit-31R]